jgi:hypothetical protein
MDPSAETDRAGSAKSFAGNSHPPLLLYGVLLILTALTLYLLGVLMVVPRRVFGLEHLLRPFNEALVWYSGVPMVLGIFLCLIDLFILLSRKRFAGALRNDALPDKHVVVALTAYNDEDSIADAVADFRAHPLVKAVIVVSNNSTDQTFARAEAAGAIVVNETQPGYGRCVFRCLTEALAFDDTELIVLCEGDMTFRADDIDKLVAYAPHADIVNGTRTVERLREFETQLSTFMFYGNLFVGKLLEAKHIGRATLTDVGTTYKLCRRAALARLLKLVDPSVNLEFNAHFLDVALANGFDVLECPVTFHLRVGKSKGGNVNNGRALKVGLRMIRGIVLGWRGLGA